MTSNKASSVSWCDKRFIILQMELASTNKWDLWKQSLLQSSSPRKMLMKKQKTKGLENIHVTNAWLLPLPIDRLGSVITRRAINPFLDPILPLSSALIPLIFLHPLSFLPEPYSLPFLCFPIHRTHAQRKCNYNTAKPILEQQASHSAVEGGWKACSHQTPNNCSVSDQDP